MKKNNVQKSMTGSKRGLKVQQREARRQAREDQHVAWLWRKVQGGMQIKFDIFDQSLDMTRPTMSRRVLARLISLQELNK